jgi:MEMO1 family protein
MARGIRKRWVFSALILLGCIIGAGVAIHRVRQLRQPEVEPPRPPAPAEPREKDVFTSPLSRMGWHAADGEALATQIDGFLANVSEPLPNDVHALILPHAGYRYSGQAAAHGIKAVAGKTFSRVIVLGPTHRMPMENVASVPRSTHYATPLGEVPLDVDFIDALRTYPMFKSFPEAHAEEHSVQIEIPLLQRALGDFRLVPIVVGQLDVEAARAMARILAGLIEEKTLVVVSSDFTHYGRGFEYVPFTDDIPENLRKLDMGAYAEIEKRSAEGFAAFFKDTGATICGRCPIMVLLSMLPEESQAHLLKYDTSGRMTGDYGNSVSYLAVAFTGAWKRGAAVEPMGSSSTLSEEDKRGLLALARQTVSYCLEHKKAPAPEDLDVEITPGMETVMGAFVTLHKKGQLRGCIGEIIPRRPLYKAVMGQAVNAAFNDRRFRPLDASEFSEIDFEISAYAEPPRSVESRDAIVLGRHGIVFEKDGRSALFLPQVAPEQGWDLEETLTHLAQKAGLSPEAWREGASFSVFEAIVFGEDDA